MKWYLHKIHKLHLNDLKVERGDPLEMYYPWVDQIVKTFSRDAVAIGALNYQDLLQAGYEGLVRAWNRLDHDRGQAEKWTFIKKRIKWSIRREIDKHGAFITVPRRDIEEQRRNLSGIDKTLVTMFPNFFDRGLVFFHEDARPWQAVQLGELLDDYLYSNVKNIDHVEILKASFGIDRDKPAPYKELALKYGLSVSNIQNIKHRLIKKLSKDEEFKKIIENFYQNV